MFTATPDNATSVRYNAPATYWTVPPRRPGLIDRYMRWFAPRRSALSDYRPESLVRAPQPRSAAWLSVVEERILGSVSPEPLPEGGEGRWLSRDIADAGIEFFRAVSDLLPGEPFIYSSRRGDLVAEFEARNGTLTSIITPESVLLFAVANETASEKWLGLDKAGSASVRSELRQLTGTLTAVR